LALRQAILACYGTDFEQDSLNSLYAISQIKKDALRSAVIEKLFNSNATGLIEFAQKIASNSAENTENRFQAINFLIRQGHPEAQEILYK
jgi:hypothetical protein